MLLRTTLLTALSVLMGCTGLIGEPGASDPGARPEGPIDVTGPNGSYTVDPQLRVMWRMTGPQYRNTIEDIFGGDYAPPAEELPSDLQGEDFFSIGASQVGTSARGVELYGIAALDVATAVLADRASVPALSGCTPTAADDPCIENVIRNIGRRLWRRPLSPEELARYINIVNTAANHEDAATVGLPEAIETGLAFALAGLLQSPNFIYISQDGEPSDDGPRYTSLDMASRLAYVVLDSTPDEELLAAGESGELVDPAAVEAQVRRLLETPRGQELVVRFFEENWEMTELEELQKNDVLFPEWSSAVASAARQEFRLTLLDIDADPEGSILDVFSPRDAYINADLAPLYDVEGVGSEFEPVPLDDQRVGLLTSVAFLASNAKPNRTSPAQRGLFILWRGLCESVPEPPMEVETELPEDTAETAGLTLRERLALHRADPACAGCHSAFDGLGLALESFDAIGRFRTEDNGAPVDPRGEFRDQVFADHRDLAAYMRNNPDASECMTTHLYRFATGNSEPDGETEMIEAIAAGYADEGPTFDDMVVELMTSVGFRHYSEEAGR